MQRHWKRYLLLIPLVAVLLYVGWRVYEDNQLSSVPRQMADSIPIPPDVHYIDQREVTNKKCRSAGIVRYYSTDLSWNQVLVFYNSYLHASMWQPWIGELTYTLKQNPKNQIISLTLSQIKTATDDMGKRTLSSGKTAYLVQVGFTQDKEAFNANCTPDD